MNAVFVVVVVVVVIVVWLRRLEINPRTKKIPGAQQFRHSQPCN